MSHSDLLARIFVKTWGRLPREPRQHKLETELKLEAELLPTLKTTLSWEMLSAWLASGLRLAC